MAITRPTNLLRPFGESAGAGYKRTVPDASQISITPGAASFTDGFPPLNFLDPAAGGVPPSGQDMNGILNAITSHTAFQGEGGQYRFDAALSTALGGYPVGVVLQSDDGLNSYVNVLASNTTNFNSTPASIGISWLPWAGTANTTLLTKSVAGSSNVTLTAVEAASNIIILTGAITANINVILPASPARKWIVSNQTTGNYSITTKTASGSGVVLSRFTNLIVYTDGTNINELNPNHGLWYKKLGGAIDRVLSTNQTLDVNEAGNWYEVNAAIAITLPPVVSMQPGQTYTFQPSNYTYTITANGAELIYYRSALNSNTRTIQPGQSVTLVTNGTVWYILNSGLDADAFASTTGTSGTQSLPNGMVYKHGSFTASATPGAATAVTFPVPFPTACNSIQLTPTSTGTTATTAWWDTKTANGFNGHSDVAGQIIHYFAIGY